MDPETKDAAIYNVCRACGFVARGQPLDDTAPGCPACRKPYSHSVVQGGIAGPAAVIAIPAQLGDFYIDRLLGQGTFGTVYGGTRVSDRRPVAVKIPHDHEDPQLLARFEQERELLRAIKSPHVVAFVDIGNHQGKPFVVTEFLPGGTLADRLTDSPLTVDGALKIAMDCLEGLVACHAAGIIHRDLKPANILFDAQGRAKLSDLGIARVCHGSLGLTRTNAVMGTPQYMAPEQILGAPTSARTDLYSLGLVMYEMLAGSEFDAKIGGLSWFARVSARGPLPLPDRAAYWPLALRQTLSALLESEPEFRPESASAVLERLRPAPISQPPTEISPEPPPLALRSRLLAGTGVTMAVAALLLALSLRPRPAPNRAVAPVVSRQTQLHMVEALRLRNRAAAAVEPLVDLLKGHPADRELRSLLAFIVEEASAADSLASCASSLKRLAGAHPGDGLFWSVAQLAAQGLHDRVAVPPDLVESFAHATPAVKECWEPPYYLGCLRAAREDIAGAVRAERTAIDKNPRAIEPRLRLAEFLVRDRRAGETRPELEQLLRQNPSDGRIRVELGICLLALSRNEEAQLQFRRCRELSSPPVLANWHLARRLVRSACYPEALWHAREAAQAAPSHTRILQDLAEIEQQVGEYAEAERHWRQLLGMEPDNYRRYLTLAALLGGTHRTSEGQKVLEDGVRRIPEKPSPLGAAQLHYSLANMHHVAKRYKEAIAEYRKNIQLANFPMAHCQLAEVLDLDGQRDEALATLRHAFVEMPNVVALRAKLAELLGRHGRVDEAEAELKRLIPLSRPLALGWESLAHFQESHERFAAAAQSWRKAIQLGGINDDRELHLADALARSGDLNAAIRIYRERLSRNPGDKRSLKALLDAQLMQAR